MIAVRLTRFGRSSEDRSVVILLQLDPRHRLRGIIVRPVPECSGSPTSRKPSTLLSRLVFIQLLPLLQCHSSCESLVFRFALIKNSDPGTDACDHPSHSLLAHGDR